MHRYKKAVDGIHAPDELKQKVLQKANEAGPSHKTVKGTVSGYRLHRWQTVAIAACLAVLLVGGAIGLIRGPQTGNTQSTSADPGYNNAPPPAVANNEQTAGAPTLEPQDANNTDNCSAPPYTATPLNTVQYPAMAQYPDAADYTQDEPGYNAYKESLDIWRDNVEELSSGLDYSEPLSGFLSRTAQEFLTQTNGQNTIYSPLNLYMALSMLAETTAGNSQTELLDLLGAPSLAELRDTAKGLWLTNYRADGQTDSVLANSLWLNENLPGQYNESTLQTLAEDHYTSLFEGPAGDPAYDEALQAWLNNETHGLLQDYTEGITMPEDLTIGLASAIYFRANWASPFEASETAPDVFHAPTGDLQTDFMHAARSMDYTWGTNFSSISLYYQEGSFSMRLILPDEGVSTSDLLADPDALSYLLGGTPDTVQTQSGEVILSLPKFDVSSQLDLQDGLQALGVSDIFDPNTADFTALTDTPEVFVEQCIHAARVIADEAKTEAAAFTWITAPGAAAPTEGEPIVFTLDRPFLFSILGPAGVPLFVGMVCNPANS